MSKKVVKWKEIVNIADKTKKYVEEHQKEKYFSGLNKGETLYVLAKAVKNPGKDVTIPTQFVTCPKCTGTGIYENLTKNEYLKVSEKTLNWYKSNVKAPNYITWGKEKISVRLACFAFSKIIVYYNTHKQMPNTCWFANVVFATKSSLGGTLVKKLSNISNITIKTYKDAYQVFVKSFSYDYYFEDKQTESETLSRRKGNCVDLNQILYHALLELYSSDVVQIVRGTVRCTDGVYGHVWCRIKVSGNWINIDASAGAREKPLGSVICASVVSVTNINPAWAVNDTGDA